MSEIHMPVREFRQAVPEDRERILEIYSHIFDAEEKGPRICGWRRGFYPTDDVADRGIESGEMVVQLLDGKIIGSARFNREQDSVFSKARWEHDVPDEQVLVLHTLTVDPLCSGCGGGHAFMDYYEDLAREMGCTDLRIDTGGTNTRAQHLYEQHGFRIADILQISFDNGGKEAGRRVLFLEKYLA